MRTAGIGWVLALLLASCGDSGSDLPASETGGSGTTVASPSGASPSAGTLGEASSTAGTSTASAETGPAATLGTTAAPTTTATTTTATASTDTGGASSTAAGLSSSSGSTRGSSSSGGPVNVIHEVNFNDLPLGDYTEEMMNADWDNPLWNDGVDEGRVTVVPSARGFGNAIRVVYPEGEFGTSNTGAQWKLEFDQGFDELYVRYRVRFVGNDFDFVRGGKLPGLAGGTANSGGNTPDGTDGFSARMMWRTDGQAVQYMYHVDQPGTFGEDFPWNVGFSPDQWHTVVHRVVINSPGNNDGIVQGWLDGVMMLDRSDVRYRDVDDFSIDVFYFSTFYGGGDSSWSTTKDEYVEYDEFLISDEPL